MLLLFPPNGIEAHKRSRALQKLLLGLKPKSSVLRKNFALFQRVKPKGCKDFSFRVFSAGFASLDSGYRQRRYACFSGKLRSANHSVLSQFFQEIGDQRPSPRILI